MSQEDEGDQEPGEEEFEDYHKAYLNAIAYLQRKYNLRSRNVVIDSPKKAQEGQAAASHPTKNEYRKEVVQQNLAEKDFPKDTPPKDKDIPKESVPK